MSDLNTEEYEEQRLLEPSPAMKQLDRLVGCWKVSGEAQGQVTYEWLEGDFFLIQHVDLEHDGRLNRGIEIIGQERAFGSNVPGTELKSRYYGNQGETFDYVYELEGDVLTIWGGEKGSPAYYRGEFDASGNTLHGGWVWPGGGYQTTLVRIE